MINVALLEITSTIDSDLVNRQSQTFMNRPHMPVNK